MLWIWDYRAQMYMYGVHDMGAACWINGDDTYTARVVVGDVIHVRSMRYLIAAQTWAEKVVEKLVERQGIAP